MTMRLLATRLRVAETADAARPLVSIVVPLFNEQDTLPELIRRLGHATPPDSQWVFVNDGSRDRTAEILDELAERDPRVTVVHFTRNFGHQPAVCAGLDAAVGQCVVVIDGDLQDPPELIGEMIEQWRNGAEVVYGVRRKRKASLPKRLAYAGFYRLLNRAADFDLPRDAGDFALMDRAVVDAIRSLPERSRFVRGLRAFVGFRQVGLEYDRPNRELGESKYPLSKLIRLAVDGLFDFSSFPIRLIGWGSVVMLLAASSLGVIASVNSSWPLGLISVVLACTSVITMSLAIVGEYVRKIFVEVKARPTFLVKRIVNPQSEITT